MKRLGAIEELAGMSMLCSDKTGTLTKGVMEVRRRAVLLCCLCDASMPLLLS